MSMRIFELSKLSTAYYVVTIVFKHPDYTEHFNNTYNAFVNQYTF